jgi:hypothetical protein
MQAKTQPGRTPPGQPITLKAMTATALAIEQL